MGYMFNNGNLGYQTDGGANIPLGDNQPPQFNQSSDFSGGYGFSDDQSNVIKSLLGSGNKTAISKAISLVAAMTDPAKVLAYKKASQSYDYASQTNPLRQKLFQSKVNDVPLNHLINEGKLAGVAASPTIGNTPIGKNFQQQAQNYQFNNPQEAINSGLPHGSLVTINGQQFKLSDY